MRRVAALVLLALAVVPTAQAAARQPVFGLRAAGNPRLGYFVYSLSPGATRSGAIIVSNTGNASGTVTLFTADATTGQTTGTVYLTDQKPTKAGSWIALSASEVTLAPGQHKSVPFTLSVPAGTSTGQWVGGIVAETARKALGSPTHQKASVQIKIRDLTIVAVQSNVPGPPVVAFTIGPAKTGGQRGFQQLLVHMSSTGNTLTHPTGTVTVRDESGATVESVAFKMDTFLPRTQIDYPILLKKALPAGTYTTTVTLHVGAKTFTGTPSLTVSDADVKQVFTSAQPTQAPALASSGSDSSAPWPLIGVAAVILAAILLAALLLRRRHGRKRIEEARAPVLRSPSERAAAGPDDRLRPGDEVLEERSAPPTVPAAPPSAAERPDECRPAHLWEVAYDRAQLGGDGVWRFPHRCRNCGVEMLAADVEDASAQAEHIPS